MGSRYELTLHPPRGAGRGLQFPAANGWTARGAPAGLSSCLPTSRCVVRQPLFPIACEGAARALQGMLGREVFRVGEGGARNTWNSSCCAGARASFLEIGPCSGEACHFRA